MVTVAHAPPDDREEVARFMQAVFPKAKWGFETWQALLDGRWGEPQDSYAITVRDDGRLVGVLGLVPANRMTSDGWAKTIDMSSWYLLRDYRMQGIGHRMLDLATADPAIAVTNYSSAPAAVPVLEKAGFRVLDDTRRIWRPRADAAPLKLLSDPAALTDKDRRVLADHTGLNLISFAVDTPDDPCLLVISVKRKHDDYVTYEVMYLGNRPAFAAHARRIADTVLPAREAVLSVDQRFVPADIDSDASAQFKVPRHYAPGVIAPHEIDNLYSELVLLDLKMF
ncbi:GNAT family N-acetyltransferase [Sulfitobacter sabulilitoris]|uniref:GNAT family N-acetyltransferase n=2 Tax=Sulfitobacter sabulilitoris TaxID=2562655 RepID=A0A5S3PE83_9RHOB|nr:GNAT family N-acetyltransferase [Sulfitobacter sabulilitoris]